MDSIQYLSYRLHAMFKQMDFREAYVTHVLNEMKSQTMNIIATIVYHTICRIVGLSVSHLVFHFNISFLGQNATFMHSMFVLLMFYENFQLFLSQLFIYRSWKGKTRFWAMYAIELRWEWNESHTNECTLLAYKCLSNHQKRRATFR